MFAFLILQRQSHSNWSGGSETKATRRIHELGMRIAGRRSCIIIIYRLVSWMLPREASKPADRGNVGYRKGLVQSTFFRYK